MHENGVIDLSTEESTDDRGEGSLVFTESTGEWDAARSLPPPVVSVVPEDYDELARLAEARTVVLHHHDPGRDDRALDEIAVHARAWVRSHAPAMTCLVASFPSLPGRPSSSGCHGAPATISTGAANISSKCWIMCTKK